MTNQKILDNAPEGATHVDHLQFYWMVQDRDAFNWQGAGWQLISSDAEDFRSLADIKRIVELEKLGSEMAIIIAELRSEIRVHEHQVKRYKRGQIK